jgi:hypothetical protein
MIIKVSLLKTCKQAALSIGALLAKLDVDRLLGAFREKVNVYLGSFSLTQWILKVKSGGHLEL